MIARRLGLRGATALALLAIAQATAVAQSADLKVGRQKAQVCAVCHGEFGRANAPDAPHLAGQPEVYIATQLRNYRSGKRQHEVMTLMAKPLSDADIEALAAWYASIAFDVKPPG